MDMFDQEEEHLADFSVRTRLFHESNMYTRVKTFALSENLTETYKALNYMREQHEGQFRKQGKFTKEQVQYINHPLLMACQAHAFGIRDDVLLAAILLHDVVEDTGVTTEEIPFLDEVKELVSLVTFSPRDGESKHDEKESYYRRIGKNGKACVIKCIDRCNNVSTMAASFNREKLLEYIDETETYIIPLTDVLKNEYTEYCDIAFLLKYHIISLIETIKNLISSENLFDVVPVNYMRGKLYMNRREQNKEIFWNTLEIIKENKRLQDAIDKTRNEQQLILEKDTLSVSLERKYEKTEIIVSGKRTLEAAAQYKNERVCVLNFASATNPGGGVLNGSSAQEESICRCSTLYQCLDIPELWEKFYGVHRHNRNPLYNDDLIFSPNIVVFKDDSSFPNLLDEKDWYSVDVITCAAPNLRHVPSNEMNPNAGDNEAFISDKELEVLLESRIEKIIQTAIDKGDEILILGAFGCGAFRNPPKIVSKVFHKYTDIYNGFFRIIEFAVFCVENERRNYQIFADEFGIDNFR